MTVVVAQLGARMHYAVPRLLAQTERLHHFYTDTVASQGWPRLLSLVPSDWQPPELKRLLGRIPPEIPKSRMTAFHGFGFEYWRRRAAARSPAELLHVHLWAGKRLCELVLEQDLSRAAALYVYNSAGLELLRHGKSRGMATLLEQTICPRAVEVALMTEEQAAFPDWANQALTKAEASEFIEREQAEWQEAELILCGSTFVRDGIARCGGPSDRCRVVPYGIAPGRFASATRRSGRGPLRVLTVGSVGLRKGSPYVMEAARRMRGRAEFRMVGGHRLPPAVARRLAETVTLTGPIPRSEMPEQFAWADVFLLPSICEGSATAVYEAMAAGLPVVCTANTGSVIRDGLDGYIVPIRDADAIVDALDRLAADPALRAAMAANARHRIEEFDLNAYRGRLLRCLPDRDGAG